jgi:hypothetical protein
MPRSGRAASDRGGREPPRIPGGRGGAHAGGTLKRFAVAELAIGDREFDPEPADVLELAARSGCSTYDCEYAAVARALGVPLVTADKQVLQAFPGTAVSPGQFLESPRR